MDLLKNNDVFHDENSEDSFNIEFKNDSGTENTELNDESDKDGADQIESLSSNDYSWSHSYSRSSYTRNSSKNTKSNQAKPILRSYRSTKLVGMYLNSSFF